MKMRIDTLRARRLFVVVLGALLLLLGGGAAWPAPPNIVFILADDLGYGDLGCYGQTRIKTPHIDALAKRGVRLTQAYSGSTVCAPSRCALLTGFHTGRAHVRGNRDDLPLDPNQPTLAEVLKTAGYATGIVGKWGFDKPGGKGTPTRRGFDEFVGYQGHRDAHEYYPAFLWKNEQRLDLPGNADNKTGDYSHDRLTSAALDFLDRKGKATPAKPFFLYLAFTIPHARLAPPDQGRYAGENWPPAEKNFAAMVTRLDTSVGQVMKKLDDLGIAKNTLIVLTSDNGPHQEGHNPDFFNSNGALKGIKRDLYEGGIRVPFLLTWPGKIAPGTTSKQIVAFWDVLPTLADAAGARAPAGLDGVSLLPALLRGGGGESLHAPLYWEFHERGFDQAVRDGNWKAVRHGTKQSVELYDLSADLGETTNVAAQYPAVAARMTTLLATLRTESPFFPINETPRKKPQQPPAAP